MHAHVAAAARHDFVLATSFDLKLIENSQSYLGAIVARRPAFPSTGGQIAG